MYLISDNVDTYTGMRLAGVDGVVVHEKQELRDALETAMNDRYRSSDGTLWKRISGSHR